MLVSQLGVLKLGQTVRMESTIAHRLGSLFFSSDIGSDTACDTQYLLGD